MTMRARIMVLTAGMTALVILAFAVPLGILARQVIDDNALAKARSTTVNVADFCNSGILTTDSLTRFLTRVNTRSETHTAVLLPGGTIVGDDAHHLFSADDDGPIGKGRPPHGSGGYATTEFGHDGGTVIELHADTPIGPIVVRSYLSDDHRHSGVLGWWALIGAVSLALLTIAVIAAGALSGRLVRPLADTAETAHRLAAGESESRAPTDGPEEVARVSRALNRLADRIEDLLAAEREAVADVSHRLRTPLTALRLDVENLPDSATATSLSRHVTNLERSLTAVIHAARRPQREGIAARANATVVVADRVRFWTALAEDQNREVQLELPDHDIFVRAAPDDLGAAVDALIENVFAHTGEGTPLIVRLRQVTTDAPAENEPDALLEVADEGPGMTAGAGSRGRSDRGSSGLGLDIARSCARSSGGSFEILPAEPHGTVVRMRLGRA